MIRLARTFVGAVIVSTGLYMAVFGNAWAPIVFELLPASDVGDWLELFVPFLPMALIAVGVAIFFWRTAG